MPRHAVPSYRHHKPSGQAVVTLRTPGGARKDVYLGPYKSPESKAEYARLLAELQVSPAPVGRGTQTDPTVNEIVLAFWKYAEQHYRHPDGTPTDEQDALRQTLKPLRELYGHTPARDFGPVALKAVRQRMIDAGYCRTLINQRIGRLKRVFRWATSEELIPVAVYQALATVAGLQRGRCSARDTEPVGPVAEEDARAVMPFVRPEVAGMIELQLRTGMRPGEVCLMRPCDVDTSGPVWTYRPPQHKTAHRGKPRVIALGPKAQSVLERFQPADPTAYYFSPRRTVEAQRAERAAVRKTSPARVRWDAERRKGKPRWTPAECYTTDTYHHAIVRGIERCNAARGCSDVPGGLPGPNLPPIPHWHPNQLRHTFATVARRRYGLEGAQVSLGHSRADVTQVYAERDLSLAAKVAAEIG